MNALPTGMYQPGESVLHRLCPWMKLVSFGVLVAAVVTTDTVPGYLLMGLFGTVLLCLSRLEAGSVLAPVWRLRWFFLVIFLMNVCFYAPQDPWFRLWMVAPSAQGCMQGLHTVARVALLLVFSGLLTGTTAPLALTAGIETLLRPLALLRVPVGQIAMILSVAIQFIPTLFEETDQIRRAQTARGARFDSRRLTQKAAAVMPLVVPIFLAAFKRADELSLAMEARGYRTDAPNPRLQLALGWADVLALMICAGLCAIAVIF